MRWRWPIIVVVLVLAVTAIFPSSVQCVFKSSWPTDSLILTVLSPVTKSFRYVSQGVSDKVNRYIFLVGVEEKYQSVLMNLEKLRLENLTLRQQVEISKQQKTAAEIFEGKLSLSQFLPAQILVGNFYSASRTLLVDKGEADGVSINDPVLTGAGLVGRVLNVYPNSSKVLLVLDPNFAVDTISEKTGTRLLVSGLADMTLEGLRQPFLTQIEYLENAKDVNPGDLLLTSGMGGVYPAGIPVGKIDRVRYSKESLFDTARVLPSVDFAKLTNVTIMKRKSGAKP